MNVSVKGEGGGAGEGRLVYLVNKTFIGGYGTKEHAFDICCSTLAIIDSLSSSWCVISHIGWFVLNDNS